MSSGNYAPKKLVMTIYGVTEQEASKIDFKKKWCHPKTVFYHYMRRFISEFRKSKKASINTFVEHLNPDFMELHAHHTDEMVVAAYQLLKLIGGDDIFDSISTGGKPITKLYSPDEIIKVVGKVDKINIDRYREIYSTLFDVQWSMKPISQWIVQERINFINSILDRMFSVRIEYMKQEPPYYTLKPRPQYIKK
jgi:hypothetical protein